jgi:hypothetical protein
MMSKSFKKIIVLGLFVVSCGLYASNLDKELIVKQCHDLSEEIVSLVSSQGKRSCVEKLGQAANQIENAIDWIIEDDYQAARNDLQGAVYDLQYAELNNCNRYIQISHSKFEAQKIKNLLNI